MRPACCLAQSGDGEEDASIDDVADCRMAEPWANLLSLNSRAGRESGVPISKA